MDLSSNHPDPDSKRESLRTFSISGLVMLPWPIVCAIFQTRDENIELLIYFFGAFLALFVEEIQWLSVWMYETLPAPLGSALGFSIIGLLILMWMFVWSLPLFSRWGHLVSLLWFAQFSYAVVQALCGWYLLQK